MNLIDRDVLPEDGSAPTAVSVERKVTKRAYTGVACGKCRKELKPVFPDTVVDGVWQNLQADDAAMLRLSGSYGMYVDPLRETDGSDTFLLCRGCADWLCEQVPGFALVVSRLSL